VHRSRRRQRLAIASFVAFVGGLLLTDTGVNAEPRVVLSQFDGEPVAPVSVVIGPDVVGAYPAVSGDGRFVVFQGASPEETSLTDVDVRITTFVTDRSTGNTIELSPLPAGIRSGDTILPNISGDGCVVAVLSELPLDVFRDDDRDGRWDVYRTVLPHCEGAMGGWELVSTRPGTGGLSRDDVALDRPAIDRAGTRIAYSHSADHYFEAGTVMAVSLVDLEVPAGDPLRSRLATGLPLDLPDNPFTHTGMSQPVLSDDGEFLAFRSSANSNEVVPSWSTGPIEGEAATEQVYVWEITNPDPFSAIERVSRTVDGAPVPSGASDPDISRDGMVVTFISSDAAIVPDATYPTCDLNCPSQVFVVDRDADGDGMLDVPGSSSAQLVSAVPGEDGRLVAGLAASSQPAISGNGQLVAFTTKAIELQLVQAPGVGSGVDGDVLLAQLERGTLQRLSVVADDPVVPAPGLHANPALNDTGRTALFDSAAAGQLAGLVLNAMPDPESTLPIGRRVVARVLPPRLSLPDADLGTTIVGLEGDEWYLAVINDGPSSFQPTEVTISNPEFTINEELSSCLLGASVPAGDSCTIYVSYKPTRPGVSSAVLRVAELGFDGVAIESNLAGAGGVPTLRIDPGGADLGAVVVGNSSVEFQFDVQNIDPVIPTSLQSFELTGSHVDDFELTTNNCVDRPLNPRATCSLGVIFRPTDEGRRTALVALGTPTGQYTTMVIAGDGRFEPLVDVDVSEVRAGDSLTVMGSGYAVGSEVTVVFGDEPDDAITVVADAEGRIDATVPVGQGERAGSRNVIIQSGDVVAVSPDIEIEASEPTINIGIPGFGLGG